jgi:hypothetical protein
MLQIKIYKVYETYELFSRSWLHVVRKGVGVLEGVTALGQ